MNRSHAILPRSVRALAAGLGSALLLSACGAGAPQPGQAAVVGDQPIPLAEVDGVSDSFCSALVEVGQITEPVPMKNVRAVVVQAMVTNSIFLQLGEEYGVEPSGAVQAQIDQIAQSLSEGDVKDVDAVAEVASTGALATDVLPAVGAAALSREGIDGATPEDAMAKGQELVNQWVLDHEIDIDPRFGIRVGKDGVVEPVDQSLSMAVSPLAWGNAAETEARGDLPTEDQLDPAQAAADLPAGQLCS